MFLNKTYFLVVTISILIALSIGNSLIMLKEYRLHNIYGHNIGSNINLIQYYLESAKDKVRTSFFNNSDEGFEVVDFIIPEQSAANLMANFPLNVKKWEPAYFKYPDGSFRKVKIKYRGDNPKNWRYQKKSLRVEVKKKRLINNQRVINFLQPNEQNFFATYISYFLGKQVGLLTPDSSIVEMRINGENQGIYFQIAHVDEIMLRRNNSMPVNIYKGEQYYTERTIGRSVYLFNNPYLWSKLAVFNQREDDDYQDLQRLINLLRLAETSIEHFNELTLVADVEEWAKFSAFQTLLQSWHNDADHNMRIVSDLWSGSFTPIAYDTRSVFTSEQNKNLIYDKSPHSVYKLYNKSSQFLYLKYKFLYDFLDRELLLEAARHLDSLQPKFVNAWKRDPYHSQLSMTNTRQRFETNSEAMQSTNNNFVSQIRKRHSLPGCDGRSPEIKRNFIYTCRGLSCRRTKTWTARAG